MFSRMEEEANMAQGKMEVDDGGVVTGVGVTKYEGEMDVGGRCKG